jgi:hypothetical protein
VDRIPVPPHHSWQGHERISQVNGIEEVAVTLATSVAGRGESVELSGRAEPGTGWGITSPEEPDDELLG